MLSYEISVDAEKDLQEIARYTLNNWGKKIFKQYQNGLKKKFKAIGSSDVIEKSFSTRFPGLLVTKFRYHFIFYIFNKSSVPIIIGVIHEQRDIVNRLNERLNESL